MELLERAKTWWESLGITGEEASLVDEAIEVQTRKSTPVKCTDCHQHYNSTDWHDCLGKFDEIRWRIQGGKLTNSMRVRLHKKYGKSDHLKDDTENYLNSLSPKAYDRLVKEYNRKVEFLSALDPTWLIEEDLWNS